MVLAFSYFWECPPFPAFPGTQGSRNVINEKNPRYLFCPIFLTFLKICNFSEIFKTQYFASQLQSNLYYIFRESSMIRSKDDKKISSLTLKLGV
jgi:hypothetical protein